MPQPKKVMQVKSARELREAQRLFFSIIKRPLTNREKMKQDSRGEKLIRANDRLTSHERLELYAQQYWWRLRQVLEADYSCVKALLGDKLFRSVVEDYLAKHPSSTFTLRNVGAKLSRFLANRERREPRKFRGAPEMAALEWALIESFDAGDAASLTTEDLMSPALRLTVAPHVRLLRVAHPVHLVQAALRKEHLRKEASNTLSKPQFSSSRASTRVGKALNRHFHLMVYRYGFSVYVKELAPAAFRVLNFFRKPVSIKALGNPNHPIARITSESELQDAFAQFAKLGVLVRA